MLAENNTSNNEPSFLLAFISPIHPSSSIASTANLISLPLEGGGFRVGVNYYKIFTL